ncbi:hypothetical protein CEXT_663491 [Caerostris extrusa]|uniref:Uncharacterized protein n=1 Tax=Caerostris extrusa TaxID=172846 RepID=A0AAV4YCC4_CAEEX|nr:hypothetical protein CEXT_663491 [Caerostris extrusa]
MQGPAQQQMAHSLTDCPTLLLCSKHPFKVDIRTTTNPWHAGIRKHRAVGWKFRRAPNLFQSRNECKTNANQLEKSARIFPAGHNHSHSSDHLSCRVQPSNKRLIPPPTSPPFLLAPNTPFGYGHRLNLVELPVTNWHRAAPDCRFRANCQFVPPD